MLSSYVQLTGKYLKANKKRSLLTIIGIILSVALICTIGLFVNGVQKMQIESMKSTYGSWHIAYSNADDSLVSKVINNPKVSRYGFYSEGKEENLGGKIKVTQISATDKALELLPYKVEKGRLPKNENEAAMEKWSLSEIDSKAKIGSKIKFDNKEYTLVGILEDNIKNQMDGKAVILCKSNSIDKKNSVLLAEISSKTKIKAAVDELSKLGKLGKYQLNEYVLTMEGAGNNASMNSGIYTVLFIIIGIVVISTIAVIYNSFQISVVERIKQFGLLRAVGATPKQIRKIVLREATILALIGVPIGLLCGIIAIYGINFVFKLIGADSVMPMKVVLDSKIMLISGVVGIVSIYISALIPAFYAGRISPLIAISSRASITKEKIKRRKNTIVQKIFGFEGAMASKNIKRNRKRYRITVFSIIISVVLFVAFKSFMDMTLHISNSLNESKNIHFSVMEDGGSKQKDLIDDNLVQNIKSLKVVDKVYKQYDSYSFHAAIDQNREITKIKEMRTDIYKKAEVNGSEKSLMESSLLVYDSNSISAAKKYLKSGSIDEQKLDNENGVIIIGKNRIYNPKTKNSYLGPVADLNVGDEIYIQYDGSSKQNIQFGKGNAVKVKIMGIAYDEPFDFNGDQSTLKIITTESMAKKLMGEKNINPARLNISIKDIKDEETAKSQIEDVIKSSALLKVIDNIDGNKQAKTAILMVEILIYGFVIVVSLIGSVNIINTITTNIILRRREFAALKSIGLTQKGLKKMIVLEGLLYGIAGAVYGSIIGCGLSYIMFKGFYNVREFTWSIPWNAMAVAGIAAIVISYISVLSPLSRIKKENLIDVVREDY
ncbi:MAG: FtsX-like permease family protein [Clostridiaceae bacterium]